MNEHQPSLELHTLNHHAALIAELRQLAVDTRTSSTTSPNAEIHAAALNLAAEYIEKKPKEQTSDHRSVDTHLMDKEYLDAAAATLVHMATDEAAGMDEVTSEKLVEAAGILSPSITKECI